MDPLSIITIHETARMPSEEIWACYNDPNASVEQLEAAIRAEYGDGPWEDEDAE